MLHLMVAKLKTKLKRQTETKTNKSYNAAKLKNEYIQRLFTIEVENRFQALQTGNNVVSVESRQPGHRTNYDWAHPGPGCSQVHSLASWSTGSEGGKYQGAREYLIVKELTRGNTSRPLIKLKDGRSHDQRMINRLRGTLYLYFTAPNQKWYMTSRRRAALLLYWMWTRNQFLKLKSGSSLQH